MTSINSETAPDYTITPPTSTTSPDDLIIAQALSILERRLRRPVTYITSPDATKNYLTLSLAEKEREHFLVMLLDNRHAVIAMKTLFTGTIDGAAVHPREVVKYALSHNAAAVIFAHNHPSGHPEPSQADQQITKRLTDALALIDIRVLDHLIVGGTNITSFAEHGLI